METDNVRPASRKLVLVSGAGRSGTSTAAGALKHLGFHVPPPELEANEANPRGYFEPRWAINFHKRLLKRASVQTMDARPDALEYVTKVLRGGGVRKQLTEWLGNAFEQYPHLVVKDPRAFWARDLWVEMAERHGAETTFLTMLRHPAEVVGSRDTYYMAGMAREQRAAREISHLAGWVNATLINEFTSRGHKRAFVQYADLLTDWRLSMSRVSRTLDLAIPDDQFAEGKHHPIDDFIDTKLHRVHLTWDDLVVPDALREQAEELWTVLSTAGDTEMGTEVLDQLDDLRGRYRALYLGAVALAHDEVQGQVRIARKETRRKVLDEVAAGAARAAGGKATVTEAKSSPSSQGFGVRLGRSARGGRKRAAALERRVRMWFSRR